MKKQHTQQHIDAFAALLLFGIFAACVLAILLTGAGAYRRLTERDQVSYERRTCVQYIVTRVHQSDSMDQVSVEQFGGVPALKLLDENGYVTRVYCYDGWLMELYTSVDADLEPADGEQLLKADGLELSMDGNLLDITVTQPDGTQENFCLSLRAGEGEAA